MCLLTYFPSNRQPNEENLRNGSYINNDGHGWAIVSNGTILTGHSLNADVAIREFVSTRKTHPNGPALFHSRFTTHGSTNLDNCHPFAVNGDQRTVIGHNGILACGNTIPKEDTRSDTRFFADEILPTFKFWRKRVQRHLEGMIGSYNKIVILNVNPRIPFAAAHSTFRARSL